ncbi:MAG: type II secretion system F family protein [Bacillota bacterium]
MAAGLLMSGLFKGACARLASRRLQRLVSGQGAQRGKRYSTRRRSLDDEHLLQAVESIAAGLKSGLSVPDSLNRSAEGADPSMQARLKEAWRLHCTGMPLAEAFDTAFGSVVSADLKLLTDAIAVQQASGGSLLAILSGLGLTIRTRQALRSSLRAKAAEARFTATVLAWTPVVLGAGLAWRSPSILTPLISSSYGRLCLGVSLALWCLGVVVSRRLTDLPLE